MARFGPSQKIPVPQQSIPWGLLIFGLKKYRSNTVPWQSFMGQARGPSPWLISLPPWFPLLRDVNCICNSLTLVLGLKGLCRSSLFRRVSKDLLNLYRRPYQIDHLLLLTKIPKRQTYLNPNQARLCCYFPLERWLMSLMVVESMFCNVGAVSKEGGGVRDSVCRW